MNKSSLFVRSKRTGSVLFSTHQLSTLTLFLALTGCTTNFTPGALIKVNTVPASNPYSGTSDGSNQGAFLITRTLIDRTFTSLLNVIGDQSGAIGNFCDSTNGATGANGNEAVCTCTFSYSTPSAPNQQVDVPIVYQETDLVRCPISGVPPDATDVSISIHVTGADLYSNSLIYTSGSSTTIIDTTDPESFIKVNRFQCRDRVWIPYLFDNSIYDPYQSEDPHLSYPLDFYTTNLGSTIALYAGGVDTHPGLEYWDCPPILTPQDYLGNDLLYEDDYSRRFNLNMKIYSWEGQNGGDNVIYPPQAGNFDRSTFYLAKTSSGAFTVPINAYIAPMIVSGTTDIIPLGFGVRPVVSTAGGLDQCITDIPIPPGYHWVKVWLFRAALPPRQYLIPGDMGGESLNQVAAIFCNPGVWTDPQGTGSQVSLFPSCSNDYTTGIARLTALIYPPSNSRTTYLMDRTWPSTYYLSSRVISYDSDNLVGSTSCVNLQTPGTNTPHDCSVTNSKEGTGCGGNQNSSNPALNDYADFWETDIGGAFNANNLKDPLSIHNTPGNASSNFHTPNNNNLKTASIDTNSNRYDFLFVVSPPNVSLTDMVDTTPGTLGRKYQPYRFYIASDCSSNPDAPMPSTDCDKEHNAITTYGIKRHDVKTNGDTPPTATSTPWIFPVCAIQPDIPNGK